MHVAVSGSMRNFVGKDGSKNQRDWKGDYIPEGAKNNQNEIITKTRRSAPICSNGSDFC